MRGFNSPKVIMITGAAGYVGAMLCHQFSKSPDLEKILAVDVQTMPAMLKDNKKIVWITADLTEKIWRIPALINKPEVVIHCAWGVKDLHISKTVFEFCFKNSFVKKLIYLSDALAYGAYPENTVERPFIETDELKEEELLLGTRKRSIESDLRGQYEAGDKNKQVFVLRPVSITGPRWRSLEIKNSLPFFPVGSSKWCKQFIHEDDVTDIVAMLTFGVGGYSSGYEIYNLAPNDAIVAEEVARIVKKPLIKIPPLFMRLACYLAWTLSGGKTETPKGAWRSFCYSIPVDGSMIAEKHGFEYFYSSHDALAKDEGRYSEN